MSDQVAVLKEIVQELERDPQIIRIKKLLLLSCTGHWESDNGKISLLDTTRLIHRLRGLSPKMDVVERRLRQAAAYLNKPMVYDAIATALINKFTRLYYPDTSKYPASPASGLSKLSHPNAPSNGERTQLSFQAPPSADLGSLRSTSSPSSRAQRNLRSYDWFEVRTEVMRTTNPMRVKVLVFFTLEPQNNFNAYTWASIKSELLDRLLYRLCESCSDLPLLEERVHQTVNRFPEADDYAQTAQGMLRVLDRLVYGATEGGNRGVTSELEAFGATGHVPDFKTFDVAQPKVQLNPGGLELDDSEQSRFVMDDAFTRTSI
ncbi:MAG: hypothetical protein AAF889_05670 [Cyanobacteria bacterium P01_D01_bin.73]